MALGVKVELDSIYWKHLLSSAKVSLKEIADAKFTMFISRVVTTFLRANSFEKLDQLTPELWDNLIEMLDQGLEKQREMRKGWLGGGECVKPPTPNEVRKIKGLPPIEEEPAPVRTPSPVQPSQPKELNFDENMDNSLLVLTLVQPSTSPMEIDDDDPLDPSGAKKQDFERKKHFECLSRDNMIDETRRMTQEMQDVLKIPYPSLAASLLRIYSYNKDALVEEFVENPKKVCQKAGIPYPFSTSAEISGSDSSPLECLVCMDEYSPNDSFALPCGHRYCAGCWRYYLDTQIDDGPGCISAHCMAPSCIFIVHEEAFKKCASPEKYARYKEFLLRSFVEDNPRVKWCPAPDCGNCIRVEMSERTKIRTVTCTCGFRFCFQCRDREIGDHSPAACDTLETWRTKAASENENLMWVLQNTKKCPKCKSPIEKNGGCMHMTCQRGAGGCGYEFCWLCRGDWKEHGGHTGGYYACNKYEKDKAKYDANDPDKKEEAERYLFYFHRYDSHKNAMKIAEEQVKKSTAFSQTLIHDYKLVKPEDKDADFLVKAATQIFNNRRALQWSYVFGFFLKMDKVKSEEFIKKELNLFEYLQEDLEKFTNYLSELYERPSKWMSQPSTDGEKPSGPSLVEIGKQNKEEFDKWMKEIVNYTAVCRKFLDNFNDGVSKGLTDMRSLKEDGEEIDPKKIGGGGATTATGGRGRGQIIAQTGTKWVTAFSHQQNNMEVRNKLLSQVKANNADLASAMITYEEWKRRNDGIVSTLEASEAQRKHAKAVFDRFDTDQSGGLDANEFRNLSYELGMTLSEEEVKKAIQQLDEDGNGTVEFEEFFAWFSNPETHAARRGQSDTLDSLKLGLSSLKSRTSAATSSLRSSLSSTRPSQVSGSGSSYSGSDSQQIRLKFTVGRPDFQTRTGLRMTYEHGAEAVAAERQRYNVSTAIPTLKEEDLVIALRFAAKAGADSFRLGELSAQINAMMQPVLTLPPLVKGVTFQAYDRGIDLIAALNGSADEFTVVQLVLTMLRIQDLLIEIAYDSELVGIDKSESSRFEFLFRTPKPSEETRLWLKALIAQGAKNEKDKKAGEAALGFLQAFEGFEMNMAFGSLREFQEKLSEEAFKSNPVLSKLGVTQVGMLPKVLDNFISRKFLAKIPEPVKEIYYAVADLLSSFEGGKVLYQTHILRLDATGLSVFDLLPDRQKVAEILSKPEEIPPLGADEKTTPAVTGELRCSAAESMWVASVGETDWNRKSVGADVSEYGKILELQACCNLNGHAIFNNVPVGTYRVVMRTLVAPDANLYDAVTFTTSDGNSENVGYGTFYFWSYTNGRWSTVDLCQITIGSSTSGGTVKVAFNSNNVDNWKSGWSLDYIALIPQ